MRGRASAPPSGQGREVVKIARKDATPRERPGVPDRQIFWRLAALGHEPSDRAVLAKAEWPIHAPRCVRHRGEPSRKIVRSDGKLASKPLNIGGKCGARLAACIASASINLCAAMTIHEPPKTLLSRSPCPRSSQHTPAVALPTSHNPRYDLRTCRIWQFQRIPGGRKLSMNPHSSGVSSHGELRNRGCAARKSVHQLPPLKSSQRIDQSEMGAVATHVVMLMPMHRPCDSAPLTVTFDTNTLASVVAPETAQRGTGESGGIVAAAMRAGRFAAFSVRPLSRWRKSRTSIAPTFLGGHGSFPMPHRPARIISLSRLASGTPEILSTPDPLTGFRRHWS